MNGSGAALPLYRKIADAIRARIDSREYAAGVKLPSEMELCDEYAASRITIRKAVELLVEDGVVTKIQGKGTFVNEPKILRKITPSSQVQSFTEACMDNGVIPSAKVIDIAIRDATKEERDFFNLNAGDQVIAITRLRCGDGIPVMLENNVIMLECSSILKSDLNDVSMFDSVEKACGRRPEESISCFLNIVTAAQDMAEVLSVREGEPLFREQVRFADIDGLPVMSGDQYIVGSRYTFSI